MVKVDETRKLPVWSTIAAAFGFCWDNRGRFLRLALLPVLGVILLDTAKHYAFDIEAFDIEQDLTASQLAAELTAGIAGIAILTPFCVAWSRLLLTREIDPTAEAGLRIGWREGRYFVWSLIILALVFVPMLLALSAAAIVEWWLPEETGGLADLAFDLCIALGLLASFWVGARLLLVLPAIAVTQRVSIAMSWRLTRGSGLRVAVALAAALLPSVLLWLLTFELDLPLARAPAYVTALALNSIVDVLATAVAVTVSCLCFCVFTGWPRRDLLRS